MPKINIRNKKTYLLKRLDRSEADRYVSKGSWEYTSRKPAQGYTDLYRHSDGCLYRAPNSRVLDMVQKGWIRAEDASQVTEEQKKAAEEREAKHTKKSLKKRRTKRRNKGSSKTSSRVKGGSNSLVG